MRVRLKLEQAETGQSLNQGLRYTYKNYQSETEHTITKAVNKCTTDKNQLRVQFAQVIMSYPRLHLLEIT